MLDFKDPKVEFHEIQPLQILLGLADPKVEFLYYMLQIEAYFDIGKR